MSIRTWVQGHEVAQRQVAIKGLADACGVSEAAVRHWIAGIRKVKSKYWTTVQEVTGLSLAEIRPDIFGPAPPAAIAAEVSNAA
jgi:DNA-binding transcriptional regulator YdaS (Cro superfamily)